MFVHNNTDLSPVLARGAIYGDVAVASINLELTFAIGDDGSLTPTSDPVLAARTDDDPPDIRRKLLWSGTSVTAFGHVRGPAQPPYAAPVRIRVGDRSLELAVFGARRWQRTWSGYAQSAAEPFERIALRWQNAFGGSVHIEPGFFPGTELPHPGGIVALPENPEGIGYALPGVDAEGIPLPHIEVPNALMQQPTDTPEPAGCAPRAHLKRAQLEGDAENGESVALRCALAQQHHAPPALTFDTPLAPGTPLATTGIGGRPLSFVLPPSPLVVHLRRGKRRTPTRDRIRSVHVDADRQTARICWGHFERYSARRAPRFVDVEARP